MSVRMTVFWSVPPCYDLKFMCHSDVQRTLIPVQPLQASALHKCLQFTDICLHYDSTGEIWCLTFGKKVLFCIKVILPTLITFSNVSSSQ